MYISKIRYRSIIDKINKGNIEVTNILQNFVLGRKIKRNQRKIRRRLAGVPIRGQLQKPGVGHATVEQRHDQPFEIRAGNGPSPKRGRIESGRILPQKVLEPTHYRGGISAATSRNSFCSP